MKQVNMAPLTGAEETVDELNKRWEQIQQQTKDRCTIQGPNMAII